MKRNLDELISQMTLEEKASLCSGASFWNTKSIDRLEIPAVMVNDGPHGLRKQGADGDHLGLGESIRAVCFPAACATAASFDVDLMNRLGEVLGEECQAEDVSILLGPAVNIKRSPLCGRNFEYISEDPYLTGKLAAAYIKGVQSWDVGTSIKHFAANNQEYNRMSVSADVSERALREIYLPGFEEAVKAAQPKTVMCSYNRINGVYSAENNWLLTQVLRKEWGFNGYVVTDWGAVGDRVKGIIAGLDLEMPGGNLENDKQIVDAVRTGELDEDILNLTVKRLLTVLYSFVDHRHPEAKFDRDADHELATQMAAECAVLLTNNGVLPLSEGKKVVYIGGFAADPRYQGGGSSHINACKVTSALETAQDKGRPVRYIPGFSTKADILDGDISIAVAAAAEADVAVVFAGLPEVFESEGYDRKHMKLPKCQEQIISAVAAVQPNTVVVLHNGSPVECPWADDVAAVLEMYLGGQGVGEACDQLLWGEKNPCGRLAETFPIALEHNPSHLNFPGDGKSANYAEGVYVGYRYYDAKQLPVRWAFGHGLSYTSYAYSNLKLSSDKMDDNSSITVSVEVTNTGTMAGKEVVQVYVADGNGTIGRPPKELKGFVKVALQAGETKTVSMTLTSRAFSYWEEQLHDWFAPSGTYSILVGHACDKIVLSADVQYTTSKFLPVTVTGATTVGELLNHPVTAPVMQQIIAQASSGRGEEALNNAKQDESAIAMIQAMMVGMPLKTLSSFGAMTPAQVDSLITMFNGLFQK